MKYTHHRRIAPLASPFLSMHGKDKVQTSCYQVRINLILQAPGPCSQFLIEVQAKKEAHRFTLRSQILDNRRELCQ